MMRYANDAYPAELKGGVTVSIPAFVALLIIGALALFTPIYVVVAFIHDMLFRKSKRWLTGHRDEERARYLKEHPEILNQKDE